MALPRYGNTSFELTLRAGVTFSDGAPLTADGVRKHLQYVIAAAGTQAAMLAGATVTATGPLTVRIDKATADPMLPEELTQELAIGAVISPTALDAPDALATSTAGAGPYRLDPAATVSGDHYTYVVNPTYWNPGAARYTKIVFRVLASPAAAINALRTNQIDVAAGDFSTADSAVAAGLQVKYTPFVFQGLVLNDRAGASVRALGDVRVRQAINFAIDRATLSQGLVGRYGMPTTQTVLPGTGGFSAELESFYAYDPDKARQLLAAAGYPQGFTLPVLSTAFGGIGTTAQAVADQLGKVGITVEVHTAEANSYINDVVAGTYPAMAVGYGAQAVYIEGRGLAAAAEPAVRADLDRQIVERLVKEAWFAPVLFTPVFFYAQPGIGGLEVSPQAPVPNPVDWFPGA